jgi:hypothetical protein
MNQYTVTFTIPAQSAADIKEWVDHSDRNHYLVGLAGNVDIKELDPETHYGGLLAESESEQGQKSADGSPR